MASPRGPKEQNRALALGALIRKLRRDQGLTLAQLANAIGRDVREVKEAVTRRRRSP